MIKTKEFSLTRPEYFKIIVGDFFERRKFRLMILFGVVALLGSLRPVFFPLWLGLVVVLVLNYILYLRRFAYDPDNRLMFRKVRSEISDSAITVYDQDGNVTTTKFEYLVEVVRAKTHYLLYFSKRQFFYLPLAALTKEEREQLDAILKTRGH